MADEAALIEGLEAGARELADEGRADPAQHVAQLLLAIDTQEARNAYGNVVRRLPSIDAPELIRATLGGVLRRVRANWPRWLDPIDTRVLAGMPDAEALVTAAAKKLWEAEGDPESLSSTDDRAQALASLARLSEAATVDPDALGEAMRAGIGGPATDESTADNQTRHLALAYEFVDAGVVQAHVFSAPVLDAISQALETHIAAPHQDGALATELVEWAPRLALDANAESRTRFRNAVEISPWCPSPVREIAMLSAAAAIASRDGIDVNPYSPDAVADLVEQYGAALAPGLAAFIGGLAGGPNEVAVAVAPLADKELPQPVTEALENRAGGWTGHERAEFILPFIANSKSAMPSPSFLSATHYADADQEPIADALVELYRSAGNNDHRERVLQLWRALAETEEGIRRRLIEDIAIPMAQHGKGALDLVVKYLDVTLPAPHGTKQKLRSTLRDRAKGKEQRKSVDRALLEAGLVRRRGLFGGGREDT